MRRLASNHHDQLFISRRKRRESREGKRDKGKKNRFHKSAGTIKRGSKQGLITKEQVHS
jgi:hypothetical protein